MTKQKCSVTNKQELSVTTYWLKQDSTARLRPLQEMRRLWWVQSCG